MSTFRTVYFPARAIDEIPPELLIEICSINARQIPWPEDHFDDRTRKPQSRGLPQDILDTIHASHVCRRWREILLSVPRFWTNMVDPYDTEWSNVILERSAPLGVAFVPFRRSHEARDLQKELVMVKRLRERLAEYHTYQLDPIISALQDVPVFPALRVFSQRGFGQFPPTFPGEATPALETLHLSWSNCPSLERVTAVSHTLTRLFVIVPYIPRTVGFWGNLMSQLPRLEVVALKRCFATVDPDFVDSYRNFQTSVVEFSVHDFAEHLAAFIPRIQFGKSLARLRVECRVSGIGDRAHFSGLESYLVQSFSNKAKRIFQHDPLGITGTSVFDLYFESHLGYHPPSWPHFMTSLENDTGTRTRWFMDMPCKSNLLYRSYLPPTFLNTGSNSDVDFLNISYFNWLWDDVWENLCPVLCKFTNLQIFRITLSLISRFMFCVNSSKYSANIFPFLRGVYLDIDDLVVSGYRDVFLSNTGSDDESEGAVDWRTSLLTESWGYESDGSSSIYKSQSSDDSNSDEGDEVEEVVDKDGNRWDDHSIVQELESVSVEQVVQFCKARLSIRFVSLLDVPEKEALVMLRERLGEMGVELRKHDKKCFDMVAK